MSQVLKVLRFALFAVIAANRSGAEPGGRIGDQDEQAFKWFSSVVCASSKGLQPVEIWTGHTNQGGDDSLEINSITEPGFLIEHDGKRFSTLSLWFIRRDFIESDELEDPKRVCFESRSMDELVAPIRTIDEFAASLRDDKKYGFFNVGRSTGPPDSPALTDFIIAWHCWNQDRPDLALFFLERMKKYLKPPDETASKAEVSIREQLTADAANFLFDRITVSFGNPKLTRANLRVQLRVFIQHFQGREAVSSARCLADAIDSLINEEQVSPLLSDADLAKLPPADQAVELVRRFRNQGLPQDRPEDNFFGECLKLGDFALPALIAAVDDHRPTRIMSARTGLGSIGGSAFDAIKYISGWRFKNYSRASVYSPSPSQPSAMKIEIESWWAEYQSKGTKQFLIEAALRGDDNSVSSALRLLKEFPEEAGPVLVASYYKLGRPHEKSNFIGGLYHANNPECIALLRHELELGDDLNIREAAARSLQALGQDGTTAAMLKEWRKIQDHGTIPGTSGVIRFLANSLDVDAIRQLTENLHTQPLSSKMAIIDELAGAFEEAGWNRGIQTPPEIQRLIEDRLVALLLDDHESWGMSGVGYSDPAVGDQAAWRLSRILPNRYQFDRSASFEERETARLNFLNIWRSANGMDAAQPLNQLAEIVGSPNQISEIRFADQGLQGTEVGKELKALEGKSLASEDVIGIICQFGLHLPKGVNGIQIRVVRISKPVGVRVTVWSRAGKHPETWQSFKWYGGVTTFKGAGFNQSGTRQHQDIGDPAAWQEWRTALDKILKDSTDTELVARIGISSIDR